MKCRLCGYEIGEGKDYCPMCGTKVNEVPKANAPANTDIAWNTKDFPKPKQLEDIEMKWDSGFNSFMTKDATEGYVSVEKPAQAEDNPYVAKDDPFELPSKMQMQAESDVQTTVQPQPQAKAQPEATSSTGFDAWKMPPQQEVSMPLWYTQNFTATGVMKTGPAFPIAQQPVAPAPQPAPTPAVSAQQAAAAFSAAMPDATIQYMKVDAPQPVYKTDYEAFKPNYDAVSSQEEKAPEKFNTFMTKNAEFQALLDKEYDRIHSARKDEQPAPMTIGSKFVPEARVQAQSINDFEKSLFDDILETRSTAPNTVFDFDKEYEKPAPAYEAPAKVFEAPKPVFEKPEPAYVAPSIKEEPVKAFAYESDTTDIDLDELISDPLDPKFNIHTIEMTIKQLELEEQKDEEERKNRQTRLEAMRAAREAYFKLLDEELDKAASSKFIAPKFDEVSPMFDDVVEEEPQEEQEDNFDFEEELEEEKDFTRNTIEMDEESSAAFQNEIEDATKLPEELVNFYGSDDDDEDEEREKKGLPGILKFLFVLVIVVALVEGCILGLQRFLPEAKITAQAIEMQEAVFDAFEALFGKTIE